MPAKSEEQRRFMGAELARKRAGKKTRTGMSEKQLSDYAGSLPPKGKRPHGSGEFSEAEIKQGFRRGIKVNCHEEAIKDETTEQTPRQWLKSTENSY